MSIGGTTATSIIIGQSGVTTTISGPLSVPEGITIDEIVISDNTADAFQVREGANDYIDIDTTDAAEVITLGSAQTTANTIIRHGTSGTTTIVDGATTRFTFDSNFLANVGSQFTVQYAGSNRIRAASTRVDLWGGTNAAAALRFRDVTTSSEYLIIDTVTGSEKIDFGNATENPDFNFLGSGAFGVAGAATISNSLSVAGTTSTSFIDLDNGSAAAVSVAGHVRLRSNAGTLQASESGGAWTNVIGGGGTPGGADTQLQYNNAGAFGGASQLTYDGTNLTATTAVFADGGVDRSGAAALAIGATNATDIVLGNATTTPEIQILGITGISFAEETTRAAAATPPAPQVARADS
jgi:hypothetical protein